MLAMYLGLNVLIRGYSSGAPEGIIYFILCGDVDCSTFPIVWPFLKSCANILNYLCCQTEW